MKKRNSLLLFTLTFCFAIMAQEEEYIVTNTNDTIYGNVIRGTDFWDTSKVIFKIKDQKGKKTRIDPGQVKIIKSFKGVDGDCILYSIYNHWFAKKIIDGRIKVYQTINGILNFVSKDDSSMQSTEIGLFSRRKAHAEVCLLIEDNSAILKEFNTLKGSAKNIFYIIKKYNASYE